jgi:hypothetical protein
VAMKSAAWCIPSAFVFGKKEKRGRAEMEDGPASACRGARANARLAGDLAPVAAEFVAFRGKCHSGVPYLGTPSSTISSTK